MKSNSLVSVTFRYFAFFILFLSSLQAQTLKQADLYFDGGAYYGALELYQSDLNEKDSSDYAYRQFRMGECYRKMNYPEIALGYFSTALLYGYNNSDIFAALGEIYLTLGYDKEALSAFQNLEDTDTGNTLLHNRITSCNIVRNNNNILPNRTVYPITSLNTKGSEYGVSFWRDRLIYSSTGDSIPDAEHISQRTGLGYSKMFIAEYKHNTFSSPRPIKNLGKPEANEGTFTYDPVSDKIYGSRCETDQKDCYIFEAKVKNGNYKEKGKLQINRKIYGIGHPFITPDGERIYFTSTMKGGYGAADLWYVEREGKNKWSAPINCGSEVNTGGNEVFPFVLDDKLYFTSDGLPGFGGLDLFMATIKDSKDFINPINLGKPFNTGYDDLNLVISDDKTQTLFVSNRENILQSDDIYGFNGIPNPIAIRGLVVSAENRQPLPDAKINLQLNNRFAGTVALNDNASFTLYADVADSNCRFDAVHTGFQPVSRVINIDSLWKSSQGKTPETIVLALPKAKTVSVSGITYNQRSNEIIPKVKVFLLLNDTVLAQTLSDSNGHYSFPIDAKGVEYKITASLSGYKTQHRFIAIPEKSKVYDFCKANGYDVDIPLMKVEVGVEITIKDIYYEFDQARLLDVSKKELNFLIELMQEYPEMRILIGSHTDSRGSLKYNDELSARRAKSVVDYLTENNIDRSRFTWQGYGERQLVIPDAQTEEEHQMNRRTTFTITNLGNLSEMVNLKTVSAEDRIRNQELDVMEYNKNYWIQVYASPNTLDMKSPFFQRIEEITDKTVQLRYENDGMKRYYIGSYDTKEAVSAAQELLRQNKIHGIVKQFDK